MSWKTHIADDEDSPEPLRELFDLTRDASTGEVDNVMAVHSLHPAGLDAHNRLYTAVMSGTKTLRKVEREMVALVVSLHNECHY
jgi:alkylhydroperoxidase family enzyme